MPEPITNKSQMYHLLRTGALGNTTTQYFNLKVWEESEDHARYDVWGVRSTVPGGPCFLYCPRDEVRARAEEIAKAGYGYNISMMIDVAVNVTLWADVHDTPTGLEVYGIEYPPKGASWRKLMPSEGKTWKGLAAKMLLQKHLNASSLADVYALLELYPGHVVELSACAQCIGTVPGRNTILWEVRLY